MVSVTSAVLQGERTAITAVTGEYAIHGLPPGPYEALFTLDGMAEVKSAVDVVLGVTVRADTALELAAASDTIEVSGDAPTALDDSQGGILLPAEEIDLLPVDRGPDSVALLSPGVTDRSVLGQLSISGGLGYDNLIMVDGVDIGFFIFGSTNGPFDQETGQFIEEAIDETQVITSGISAEYGRFTGGVINSVTKRGGNSFSGSLRADLTNPAWREETPLEKDLGVSRESKTNEVYSATLGGRLVEDRLWFFLAAADTSRSDPSLFPRTGLPSPNSFDNSRFQLKLTGQLAEGHTAELVAMDNTSKVTAADPATIDPRSIDSYELPHRNWIARYSGVLAGDKLIEGQYAKRDFVTQGFGGSSTRIEDSPFLDYLGDGIYNAPPFDENDPPGNWRDEQLAASLSWFLASQTRGSHDLKLGLELFETVQVGGKSDTASGFLFFAVTLTDDNGVPILDDQGRLQPIWAPFAVQTLQYLADRDARLTTDTTALYANDTWRLGEHWSFNLGLRYERAEVSASDARSVVDVGRLLPRLAATLDPTGEGRYTLSAGWAEYAGRYNSELFNKTSSARNPGLLGYLYAGPPGVGIDFEPGFDLDNYFPIFAEFPQANFAYADGTTTPVTKELKLSGAMRLGDAGFAELTYLDRDLTDIIEDFVRIEQGQVVADSPVGPLTLDRHVLANSDLPRRSYRTLELLSRYRVCDRWTLSGHWTHELENDGNFVGEDAFNPAVQSSIGDYPEILVPERNFPDGRLPGSQRDRIRIWSQHGFELGRAGALDLTLLYSYDSAQTYSLSTSAPISDIQGARDPGYAQPPQMQQIFFGRRGSQEFNDSQTVDLGLTWSGRPSDRWEPWIKLDVFNLFNDDTLRTYGTQIVADPEGPLDADGIPTTYVEAPGFGAPESPESYVTPREFRVSVGLRVRGR